MRSRDRRCPAARESDPRAVGRPHRIPVERGVLRELRLVAAVGVDRPDVTRPGSLALEGDAASTDQAGSPSNAFEKVSWRIPFRPPPRRRRPSPRSGVGSRGDCSRMRSFARPPTTSGWNPRRRRVSRGSATCRAHDEDLVVPLRELEWDDLRGLCGGSTDRDERAPHRTTAAARLSPMSLRMASPLVE